VSAVWGWGVVGLGLVHKVLENTLFPSSGQTFCSVYLLHYCCHSSSEASQTQQTPVQQEIMKYQKAKDLLSDVPVKKRPVNSMPWIQ